MVSETMQPAGKRGGDSYDTSFLEGPFLVRPGVHEGSCLRHGIG